MPAKKIVVTTSGTENRGAGVWFKFERTAEHSLEKHHRINLILEVDKEWRCDAIRVAAKGIADNDQNCGEEVFYLGLHMDKDETAKQLASDLKLSEKYVALCAGRDKVREIERYLAYPQFGYGTMAEKERNKVRKLESEFKEGVAKLRALR